jgi:hypothetical protein
VLHQPADAQACGTCLQVFHLPQLDADIFQHYVWHGCQIVILSVLSALDSESSLAQPSCHLSAVPEKNVSWPTDFEISIAEQPACDQVMAIGSTTAGLVADGLITSGMSVTNVRKLVQTIAFIVPAGANTISISLHDGSCHSLLSMQLL